MFNAPDMTPKTDTKTNTVTLTKEQFDELLHKAQATEATTEVQAPPPAFTNAVQALMQKHGDQPKSEEIDLADGLTVTFGIRNVYFNVDGDIHVVPSVHLDA